MAAPTIGTMVTIATLVVSAGFYAGTYMNIGDETKTTGESQWVRINAMEDKLSEHNVLIANNKEDISEIKTLMLTSSKDRSELSNTLSGLVEVMKASNKRADRERQERMEDQNFKKEMSKDINDIKVQMADMNARLPKS